METHLATHIFYGQGQFFLISPDSLMFGAVIFKDTAYIGCKGNPPNIEEKDYKPQYPFNNIKQDRVRCRAEKKLRPESGHGNKKNDRQHDGKQHRAGNLFICYLFLFFPRRLGRVREAFHAVY